MGISNISSNLRPGIVTSTTRPTTPYEGQVIYETDTNRVLVWDNAAWVSLSYITSSGASTAMKISDGTNQSIVPYAMAAGGVTATTNTAYQNTFYGTSAAITFPSGRFSQTPVVQVTTHGGYGWGSAQTPSSTGISFLWIIADTNGATRTMNWLAVQMVSTSGAG